VIIFRFLFLELNDYIGLKIDPATGVVIVEKTGDEPSANGNTIKIVATNSTDSGKTDNALVTVYPAVTAKISKVEILGFTTDPDDKKLRVFTNKDFALAVQIEWDGDIHDRWAGKENNVIWNLSGASHPNETYIDETGRLWVGANESGPLKIWVVSKLTGEGINEEYSVDVKVVSGAIDLVQLEVVGAAEYDTIRHGELKLRATIVALGTFTGDALFEVRPVTANGLPVANARPINDLTQIRTLPREGDVTEALFSSFRGELNNEVEVVARARDNPAKDSNIIRIKLTGNGADQSADWRVIRMGRDHVIVI